MLGIAGAAHGESVPHASQPWISKLSCSLAGTRQGVQIVPGTHASRIYAAPEVCEAFRCSYGLNPVYRDLIAGGQMRVAGTGPEGEVRIVELLGHPFFIATLYLPQLSSAPGQPHPLIAAYLRAAAGVRERARGAL